MMTGEPTQKVSRTPIHQLLSERQSSHYASLPVVFNPLPNREVFEKQLCNQSSQYEKDGKVQLQRGSHHMQSPLLYAVSKDEWNTKESTGKSMKNALHVLRYTKRHHSG